VSALHRHRRVETKVRSRRACVCCVVVSLGSVLCRASCVVAHRVCGSWARGFASAPRSALCECVYPGKCHHDVAAWSSVAPGTASTSR
jgi:hypothetical protein